MNYFTSAYLKLVLVGIGLVSIALILLWPGLYGGFYLDDFPNLGGLPSPGDGYLASLNYLLDPPVGGSGRPIAYLSFLFQADSWPGNPFPFKLVNLAIHLFNGALVSTLAYLIGKPVFSDKLSPISLGMLSLIAGFVWVILPINLSSVFYVVQRMTLLATCMTLLALIGFSILRIRYVTWTRREYIIATCMVAVGYLGIFAKETSILTGLLVLVIEYAIFNNARFKLNLAWKFVVLALPVMLLFAYLLIAGRIFGEYGYRDFSLVERLLSEIVILFDYMGKILAPTNTRINLYNDGYPFRDIVANFLLVGSSIIAWLVLLAASLSFKNRFLSLGILFFLAGHLLESTVISLELYFEHRNYLPTVGLVIALVLGLGEIVLKIRESGGLKGSLAFIFALLWIGWLGVVSAIEARVWGDPKAFAISAYTERPGSIRARQALGGYLMGAGDYMGSANVLYSIDSDFGVFSGTYAQLLMLKCFKSDIPVPGQKKLTSIFENAAFDRGTGPALESIWRMKRSSDDQCKSVSNKSLMSVIDALLNNPAFKYQNNMHVLKSLILADQGQWIPAAESIRQIRRDRVSVDELILGARYYGHAGETDKALALLDEAETLISGPLSTVVHQENIIRVRARITGGDSKPLNRMPAQ